MNNAIALPLWVVRLLFMGRGGDRVFRVSKVDRVFKAGRPKRGIRVKIGLYNRQNTH